MARKITALQLEEKMRDAASRALNAKNVRAHEKAMVRVQEIYESLIGAPDISPDMRAAADFRLTNARDAMGKTWDEVDYKIKRSIAENAKKLSGLKKKLKRRSFGPEEVLSRAKARHADVLRGMSSPGPMLPNRFLDSDVPRIAPATTETSGCTVVFGDYQLCEKFGPEGGKYWVVYHLGVPISPRLSSAGNAKAFANKHHEGKST